ncbi:hypothetical protein LTR60_006112 [Cryomyces antarcticus]|nr:hypothetical protein LTR60_006112 [Cryomyces antarcticus]
MSKRRTAALCILALALLVWILPPSSWSRHKEPIIVPVSVLRPASTLAQPEDAPDPNSHNRHAMNVRSIYPNIPSPNKPRAALISLVRNSELEGLMQSMRQLEYHWNRKYQYPWVFFNDEPFSEDFRVRTINRAMADGDEADI